MIYKLIATLAALTLLPAGSVQAAPAGQTTTLPPKQAALLYRFYFDTNPKSKAA